MRYLRYQGASPNARGRHPGIFALANGLAHAGTLSAGEHAWWAAANAWYDAAYPDPGLSDPTLFDRCIHPAVSCWFKASATDLLAQVPGYLALLERYGVAWQRVDSEDPGRVLYDDAHQVVVAPHASLRPPPEQGRAGAMDDQDATRSVHLGWARDSEGS